MGSQAGVLPSISHGGLTYAAGRVGSDVSAGEEEQGVATPRAFARAIMSPSTCSPSVGAPRSISRSMDALMANQLLIAWVVRALRRAAATPSQPFPMPARIVVVHDDPEFIDFHRDRAPSRPVTKVKTFSDTMSAITALEAGIESSSPSKGCLRKAVDVSHDYPCRLMPTAIKSRTVQTISVKATGFARNRSRTASAQRCRRTGQRAAR